MFSGLAIIIINIKFLFSKVMLRADKTRVRLKLQKSGSYDFIETFVLDVMNKT